VEYRPAWQGPDAGPDPAAAEPCELGHAGGDERGAPVRGRWPGAGGAARAAGRDGTTVGAIDETGQEKAGEATAGVKRQYLGCAGKVANGINTVHLCYVRERAGHALIGARQWIPASTSPTQ
jgi:hypothetical protein